jgi:molybdopterin-guanine dinucleotide biosynthesis protein A
MDSRYGAIILCGGESRRMARDKAWLPFGDEVLLQRVARIVGQCVPYENVAVVAGVDQKLPSLPAGVRLVRDMAPARGPLPALLAGLLDLPEAVDMAFVTGCDAPLLHATVIDWMFWRLAMAPPVEASNHFEAIVPADGAHLHPLCAAYRTKCRMGLAAAAMSGISSLHGVIEKGLINVRRATLDEMRRVDRELDSLASCNTPEEYEALVQRALWE